MILITKEEDGWQINGLGLEQKRFSTLRKAAYALPW
ncbi:MAG: hypothetical protein UV51_C0008G0019 [Candidatus Woesebacteria bacterium GW2011_GWC1_42_9]|nr:MAG: hypothetical protein UV51_C0008G0019 [Candidatus Woesebacteria bacterium GW2011_GWC1_42_9]